MVPQGHGSRWAITGAVATLALSGIAIAANENYVCLPAILDLNALVACLQYGVPAVHVLEGLAIAMAASTVPIGVGAMWRDLEPPQPAEARAALLVRASPVARSGMWRSPGVRRIERRLHMQVAADLCRDAALTLARLRANDAFAADLAIADPATRACAIDRVGATP